MCTLLGIKATQIDMDQTLTWKNMWVKKKKGIYWPAASPSLLAWLLGCRLLCPWMSNQQLLLRLWRW